MRSSVTYTTDGTLPTLTSPLYSGAFAVETDANLRAIAIRGDDVSDVAVGV